MGGELLQMHANGKAAETNPLCRVCNDRGFGGFGGGQCSRQPIAPLRNVPRNGASTGAPTPNTAESPRRPPQTPRSRRGEANWTETYHGMASLNSVLARQPTAPLSTCARVMRQTERRPEHPHVLVVGCQGILPSARKDSKEANVDCHFCSDG